LALKKTSKHRVRIRHARVRKRVSGTAARPRLAVFRSSQHVYAQVIDDEQGVTLTAASSLEGEVRTGSAGRNKTLTSRVVGELVAKRAAEKGIKTVVFDRGGNKYHGRVKALAEAAREGGLVI
jgi:large subunit ribosomal protein L18